MKTIIISTIAVLAYISLSAQNNNVNSVLESIGNNNTSLKALREKANAQKLENKTGIYLSNPEAGFNYLWGSPADIGNRTDINVSQKFDFPTISGMKSKVAGAKNELVEWEYKANRMNILLEAWQYCIDLVYFNALREELELRLKHAQTIALGYKNRLASGDANILEYNKVQLNLSTVQGEISRVEVEQHALLSQLKRLNGGTAITLSDKQHSQIQFPVSFDNWYIQAEQKNPVLGYVRQEVELSRKQVSLNKAMGLPSFSAGYMSEKVVGQRYQGISAGISIPLWENKNRVKQAKAAVLAAETRETDSKMQFYNRLQILYNRASGLKATAEAYRKTLEIANNTSLLEKALNAGEISLLNYIVEIGLYYNTVNQALESERDYRKALADLLVVEL